MLCQECSPRTIARWYQNLQCDPGFTTETLSVLKTFTDNQKAQGKTVFCQLVFDEISIFKHEQSIGNVSYGSAYESNESAKEILLFMLVSIDLQWKIPIGYFPIVSLTAAQKKVLIERAIYLAQEAGVEVLGVTFDYATENIKAMNDLGCNLKETLTTYKFQLTDGKGGATPTTTDIFVFPDPVHMLKVIRNTFANYKLFDADGREINFKYVVALYELQTEVGLNLRNKLRSEHIDYKRRPMNVRLAAQLLSRSVADDMDYCREVLKIEKFEESQATSQFIRTLNDSFDLLNSRKMSHVGFKSSITQDNIEIVKKFCEETSHYIKGLEIAQKNGRKLVVDSQNYRGFVGLMACLANLPHIFEKVRSSVENTGLCTYSLNQDHVEMFFGAVRTRLGCNTSPTVIQFRSAYKKLTTRVQIETKKGNCLSNIELVSVLSVCPSRSLSILNGESQPNKSGIVFKTEEEVEADLQIQEEDQVLNPQEVAVVQNRFSNVLESILEMTGGHILFALKKKLKCEDCLDCLSGEKKTDSILHTESESFLDHPSTFMQDICRECETYIKNGLSAGNEFIRSFKIEIMVNSILMKFNDYAFVHNIMHLIDSVDHFSNLLQLVVALFAKIRLKQELQKINEKKSDRNMLRHITHYKNW